MAPLVRMRALISGSRNGKKWPKPGQTIDLPAEEAAQLIAQGIAEDPDAAETATVADGTEKAVAPAGNKSLASIREEVKEALAAKAKEDAAKAEAGAKAKEDAAKAEAGAKAKEDAAKAEAEAKAKEDAAKAEAEAKAKEEAAKAEAEAKAAAAKEKPKAPAAKSKES